MNEVVARTQTTQEKGEGTRCSRCSHTETQLAGANAAGSSWTLYNYSEHVHQKEAEAYRQGLTEGASSMKQFML